MTIPIAEKLLSKCGDDATCRRTVQAYEIAVEGFCAKTPRGPKCTRYASEIVPYADMLPGLQGRLGDASVVDALNGILSGAAGEWTVAVRASLALSGDIDVQDPPPGQQKSSTAGNVAFQLKGSYEPKGFRSGKLRGILVGSAGLQRLRDIQPQTAGASQTTTNGAFAFQVGAGGQYALTPDMSVRADLSYHGFAIGTAQVGRDGPTSLYMSGIGLGVSLLYFFPTKIGPLQPGVSADANLIRRSCLTGYSYVPQPGATPRNLSINATQFDLGASLFANF